MAFPTALIRDSLVCCTCSNFRVRRKMIGTNLIAFARYLHQFICIFIKHIHKRFVILVILVKAMKNRSDRTTQESCVGLSGGPI